MIEDSLERIYGNAAAPAKVSSEGHAEKSFTAWTEGTTASKRPATKTVSPARDGFWLLAWELQQR